MAAPKKPGLPASTPQAGRVRIAPAPLLSRSEELAASRQYLAAKAELRLAALESPVAAAVFLGLSEVCDAGGSWQDDIFFRDPAAPQDRIAVARREIQRLSVVSRALLERRARGSFRARAGQHELGSRELGLIAEEVRRNLELLQPTPRFTEQILAAQRRVADRLIRITQVTERVERETGANRSELRRWLESGPTVARSERLARALGIECSAVPDVIARLRREQRACERYGWRLGIDPDCLLESYHRCRLARRRRDQAHDTMVCHNLRLVVWVAKRYQGMGLDLDDLVQEGNFGLFKALDKYDPELGYRFTTYATWWIRQAIQRGLADKGRTVRLPFHVHERRRQIDRARRMFAQRTGSEPTLEELSRAVGLPERDLEAHHVAVLEPRSLDGPVRTQSEMADVRLLDVTTDPEAATPATALLGQERARSTSGLLRALNRRERWVIEQRFGIGGTEPRTLEEIATELGLTRERIRQIEQRSLHKLRKITRRFRLSLGDFEPE